MRVNFNVPVRAFDGTELRKDGNPVNLSQEIQNVLFMYGKDGGVSNEDKYHGYRIGTKLATGLDDFTAEELAFIKDNVGSNFIAGVYGQLCDVIEKSTNQPNQ